MSVNRLTVDEYLEKYTTEGLTTLVQFGIRDERAEVQDELRKIRQALVESGAADPKPLMSDAGVRVAIGEAVAGLTAEFRPRDGYLKERRYYA